MSHEAANPGQPSAEPAKTQEMAGEASENQQEMSQRVIVLPHGQAAVKPAPGPVPTPAMLQHPSPVIVTAKVERASQAEPTTRMMIRDATRVFLGSTASGSGWYFQQNPVYPELVTAVYLDHNQKMIIEHDETSLRDSSMALGWSDVQALGVGADLLSHLTLDAAKQSETIAGHVGRPWVESLSADAKETVRIWWNDELAVPLRYEDQNGSFEVVAVETPSAQDLDAVLADPRLRYPSYRIVDSVDYLELKHEHAATAHPAGAHSH